MKKQILTAAAAAVALAGLLAGVWVLGTREPPPPKVVVLGVDGLDIRLLDEMVRQGELPNFARLYERGSVGSIRTSQAGLPPLSPRIWTTFATGRLPQHHGITQFTHPDAAGGTQLYSSADRRVPAIWEIATLAGKSVGVTNWWFTYPAEPVKGFMLSDRYIDNWARRSAKFYGGKLDRETAKLVYPPDLIEVLREAGLSGEEVREGGLNPVSAEKFDGAVFDLASVALDAQSVELVLIYTRALDELSHLRWHTHEQLPGEPETPDMITDYMKRYDGMLGELLSRLTDSDHLIVLSDHGFSRDARVAPGKGPTGIHMTAQDADAAAMLLVGPRFRSGARLAPVSPLDILPTVLELVGIPPSTDLPGKVAVNAMVEDQRTLLARVPPYGRLAALAEGETTTSGDEATIERLRMLGYVD